MVVAIIAILAALLLPALSKGKAKAKRVQCLNNLKQVGLGFHSFVHEHGDKFPMQVSTNSGGSLEFVQAGNALGGNFYFAFRHLQVLSNELVDPKLLVCAADTRAIAADFATLRNNNVSYFIGATADYSKPDSILAGDRNITGGLSGTGPILRVGANDEMAWTGELHGFKGNILFADGRVELFNSTALPGVLSRSAVAQNAFLTPVQAPPNPTSGSGTRSAAASPANSSALARLEELFATQGNTSGPAPTHPGDPPGVRSHTSSNSTSGSGPGPIAKAGGKLSAEISIPQPGQSTTTTTKPLPATTNNATTNVGSLLEVDNSRWKNWPIGIAKLLGSWGTKSTYLLLFIFLAVLVTIEVLRRRRAQKRPGGGE